MTSEILEIHESSRGMLRDLPGNELLTLVGRLATEYTIRHEAANHSETVLVESVGAGVGIARAVLGAQRIVRERAN